jgi:hypothetical protein
MKSINFTLSCHDGARPLSWEEVITELQEKFFAPLSAFVQENGLGDLQVQIAESQYSTLIGNYVSPQGRVAGNTKYYFFVLFPTGNAVVFSAENPELNKSHTTWQGAASRIVTFFEEQALMLKRRQEEIAKLTQVKNLLG